MSIVILIPAYKPDPKFLPFVKDLASRFKGKIVVVNDGSGDAYAQVFKDVGQIPEVTLLNHGVNQGKGAALKTGFTYARSHKESISGVVTADADGQHKVGDIMRVVRELEKNPSSIVIGARAFSGEVPLRSKFGNSLTRFLFKTFFNIKVKDTQTGLRGIPTERLPLFLAISYNHYEYETEMLLIASREEIPFIEIPIETVYENNNESSHFNPVLDSMKIYFVLLRYTLSSLLSALVDFLVFISVYPLLDNILLSTYAARCISLCVNYGLVSQKVFAEKGKAANKIHKTFPKYVLLVIVSGYISSLIITGLHVHLALPVTLAKVLSESILYIVNFYVQKHFIFHQKTNGTHH